jgi:hypothetical protein
MKTNGSSVNYCVRVGCCDGLKGTTISKLFDTSSRGEGGGSIQRKYTQVARRSTSGFVDSLVETYWVGAKFCNIESVMVWVWFKLAQNPVYFVPSYKEVRIHGSVHEKPLEFLLILLRR